MSGSFQIDNLLADSGFELGATAWGSAGWPDMVTAGDFIALEIDSVDGAWQQTKPHALFVTRGGVATGEATVASQGPFVVDPAAVYGVRFRTNLLSLDGTSAYLGVKIAWKNAGGSTISVNTFGQPSTLGDPGTLGRRGLRAGSHLDRQLHGRRHVRLYR
jgi:hypothetical protein